MAWTARRPTVEPSRSGSGGVEAVIVDNDISAYSGAPRPHYRNMLDAVRTGKVRTQLLLGDAEPRCADGRRSGARGLGVWESQSMILLLRRPLT